MEDMRNEEEIQESVDTFLEVGEHEDVIRYHYSKFETLCKLGIPEDISYYLVIHKFLLKDCKRLNGSPKELVAYTLESIKYIMGNSSVCKSTIQEDDILTYLQDRSNAEKLGLKVDLGNGKYDEYLSIYNQLEDEEARLVPILRELLTIKSDKEILVEINNNLEYQIQNSCIKNFTLDLYYFILALLDIDVYHPYFHSDVNEDDIYYPKIDPSDFKKLLSSPFGIMFNYDYNDKRVGVPCKFEEGKLNIVIDTRLVARSYICSYLSTHEKENDFDIVITSLGETKETFEDIIYLVSNFLKSKYETMYGIREDDIKYLDQCVREKLERILKSYNTVELSNIDFSSVPETTRYSKYTSVILDTIINENPTSDMCYASLDYFTSQTREDQNTFVKETIANANITDDLDYETCRDLVCLTMFIMIIWYNYLEQQFTIDNDDDE